MPDFALSLAVAFAAETTTTEVARIVGDPLPRWQVWGSGALLLVVIVGVALAMRRRFGPAH